MDIPADTAGAVDSAPATESLAPTSVETPAVAEAPEVSLDDELSSIFRKNNPLRSEDGKFSTDKPPVEQPLAVPEEPKEEIPAMPASWAKANEELWKGLSPAARDIVLKREMDSQKGVDTLKAQYEPLKELEAALTPHRALLAREGLTPAQGVQRLIKFHEAMMNDPDRGIIEVAQAYGRDLSRMFASQGKPADDNSALSQLQQEIKALKAERDAEKQALAQKEQDALLQEVQAFSQNPEYEHFEKLRPTMARLITSGEATDLKQAYHKAARLDDDVMAAIEARKKAAADEKLAAEAAKKAAGINVKSNAAQGVAPSKPVDEQLKDIWRRNHAA